MESSCFWLTVWFISEWKKKGFGVTTSTGSLLSSSQLSLPVWLNKKVIVFSASLILWLIFYLKLQETLVKQLKLKSLKQAKCPVSECVLIELWSILYFTEFYYSEPLEKPKEEESHPEEEKVGSPGALVSPTEFLSDREAAENVSEEEMDRLRAQLGIESEKSTYQPWIKTIIVNELISRSTRRRINKWWLGKRVSRGTEWIRARRPEW